MIAEQLNEIIIAKGDQCKWVKYTNPDLGNSEWHRIELGMGDFGLDTVYFHFTDAVRAGRLFSLLNEAIVGYE